MRALYKSFFFLNSLLMCTCLIAQVSEHRVQVESASLPELIDELEKSYNVKFSYPSNLLKDQTFYLKTNTPDLANILDEITAIYPIEYQVISKQSILLRNQLSDQEKKPEERTEVNFLIVDKETSVPLENAALGIVGTTNGKYSNRKGELSLAISIEEQEVSIEVYLLGYQKKTINWNKSGRQTIVLTPHLFTIDEVMIQDRGDVLNVKNLDKSVELTTNHISSFTSGIVGNDVLRQAQLLPGIAAFDERSAGLKIRGSDEASSLIILDDIPIYNASHYYGLFSSINPNYTSTTILYKNNLPVSYDGKTAGMLQINGPKRGSSKEINGTLDMNLLTLSGNVNVPINNHLSLTLAARSTYQNVSDTDLFSLFDSPQGEVLQVENFSLSSRERLLASVPDFKFFDIVSKVRYVWKKNNLEFNYYQSQDDLDDSFSNQFKTRRGRREVLNTETYSNKEQWENQGFNLKLESQISNKTSLSSLIYSTSYNNESGLGIGLLRELLQERSVIDYSNQRENFVRDYGLKSALNYTLGKSDFSAGFEIVQHNVKINVNEQENSVINIDRDGVESSLFFSFIPAISSKLRIESGIRATSFNDNIYLSPRLDLNYQVSKNTILKGSLGRHNQFVRQLTFENTFGRNLDFWILADDGRFKVSSADQMMIGGTYKKDRLTIDIESYYRKRYDLIEQALTNARFDQTTIFPLSQRDGNPYDFYTGDSKTLGLDISLGLTYPKYSGWLTYTLSKSTIQYDRIRRNDVFPTQDDRRHQIKMVNELRIGKFTVGANIIYASGKPYTDLNKVVASTNRNELSPQERLSRLPYYLRTDLAVSYKIDFPQNSIEVGLSAYNLLSRQNVSYVQYLFSIPSNTSDNPDAALRTLLGTESSLLNRTVNVSLKLRF